MKLTRIRRSRLTNRFAAIFLGPMFVLALGAKCTSAQTATKQAPAHTDWGSDPVQTFYLTNTQSDEMKEVLNAVRGVITADARCYLDFSQNAIIVEAPRDQLSRAQKVITDLDRPKKTYRLTYTITESDAGKRIGTQHFMLILVSGQRTTLKQGSKVPIATGTFDSGKASTQTQFTYLDVGINIDSTLDDSPNGVRLKSKVEQSSIGDSTVVADVREPIIRQSIIEGVSVLTLGKPLVLGGLDIPGSTRHLDIDAMVELIK